MTCILCACARVACPWAKRGGSSWDTGRHELAINVRGDGMASNDINDFVARLRSMGAVIKTFPQKLAPLAVTCVQLNMDGPFTPNAALTQSTKNKGAKPLFDTGETRASITYTADEKSFTVGSPLPHTPLINSGGSVVPKKAKSLLVPSTKGLKRKTKAMGIRRVLDDLKDAGWRIVWCPKSVLGVPPAGATIQGLPLKTKPKKKGVKAVRICLLYYRLDRIDVPKREFMVLHPEQQELLQKEAQHLMERAK